MNLTTNTTQRIDRLSNNKLYLGLKTGVSLQAETSLLTIGSANGEVLLKLGTVYKAPTEATHVAPKGYVDAAIEDGKHAVLSHIGGGTRIGVSPTYKSDGQHIESLTLNLGQAYSSSWFSNAIEGSFSSIGSSNIKYGVFTGQTDGSKYGNYAAGENDIGAGAGSFISAIKVDQFGAVVGVDYKKVAAADIDNTQLVYDNYKHWTLSVGNQNYEITSGYKKENNVEDWFIPFCEKIHGFIKDFNLVLIFINILYDKLPKFIAEMVVLYPLHYELCVTNFHHVAFFSCKMGIGIIQQFVEYFFDIVIFINYKFIM